MRGALMGAIALAVLQQPQANEAPPPADQLRAMRREHDSALQDYSRAQDRAETDEQRQGNAARYREQSRAVARRALGLAREHPRDPAAFDALIWIVNQLRFEAGGALETLARDHIESERFVEACRAAWLVPPGDSEAAEALLREAMGESPRREVRGFACYYLAKRLRGLADGVRHLERHPKDAERYKNDLGLGDDGLARFMARRPEDLEREAERLYERTIARYGDLETLREPTLGEVAEGELFDLRHLTIGEVAPEIVGQDVEGVPFKLSDYRGKVVVLTFSGNWCGPCRAMYPRERELVERLKNEPFALLSVNTDEDEATLRGAIEDGEITWRCWHDGGTDGPISLAWGIQAFPTVFILDHEGVIRYKKVSSELDEAVDTLLKEMEVSQQTTSIRSRPPQGPSSAGEGL